MTTSNSDRMTADKSDLNPLAVELNDAIREAAADRLGLER